MSHSTQCRLFISVPICLSLHYLARQLDPHVQYAFAHSAFMLISVLAAWQLTRIVIRLFQTKIDTTNDKIVLITGLLRDKIKTVRRSLTSNRTNDFIHFDAKDVIRDSDWIWPFNCMHPAFMWWPAVWAWKRMVLDNCCSFLPTLFTTMIATRPMSPIDWTWWKWTWLIPGQLSRLLRMCKN